MSGTPDSEPTVVLDTTVLSNFAFIDHVALLERLYGSQACTVLAVVEEIQRGLTAGYRDLQRVVDAFARPIGTGWLSVVALDAPEQQACYLALLETLDSGEAACLALGAQYGWVVASDDLAARRAADRLGVRLSGTIGILVRLVREGFLTLSEGNQLLGQLLAAGYRSPVTALDDLLAPSSRDA